MVSRRCWSARVCALTICVCALDRKHGPPNCRVAAIRCTQWLHVWLAIKRTNYNCAELTSSNGPRTKRQQIGSPGQKCSQFTIIVYVLNSPGSKCSGSGNRNNNTQKKHNNNTRAHRYKRLEQHSCFLLIKPAPPIT